MSAAVDAAQPDAVGGRDATALPAAPPADDGSAESVVARRPLALSPSRASDFKTCPLLYRYRAVDRLPEPPSAPAVRGTLVHSVLERMFGQPAAERTPELTAAQVAPSWEQLAVEYPEVLGLLSARRVTGLVGVGGGTGPHLLHPGRPAPVRTGGMRAGGRGGDRRLGAVARVHRSGRRGADR